MFKLFKKKKYDMGLLEISLALLFFVIFAMFLNQNPFSLNNWNVVGSYDFRNDTSKINIERNITIENPTKRDLTNLANDIKRYNESIAEDSIDEGTDLDLEYILEVSKFKI